MPPGFLKKLKDIIPKSSIKKMLHEHLTGYEKARPLKNIHASELTKTEGLCPRFYALADLTGYKPKDQYITTSEQVTFRIGRDMQDAIVHWFADMGRAIAHWRCAGCKQLHTFSPRPIVCKGCGHKAHFFPEEVRFIDPKSGASCGVDMLMKEDNKPKLTPVEIKTIDKEEFKKLMAPLAEHRVRTTLYLDIIKNCKEPYANLVDPSEGKILYASKGGYGCADTDLSAWGLSDKFSPFKEYMVTPDKKLIQPYQERAALVTGFRKGEHGMPRGLCSTAFAKRAQYCPCKAPCFSGEYPVEKDWTVE